MQVDVISSKTRTTRCISPRLRAVQRNSTSIKLDRMFSIVHFHTDISTPCQTSLIRPRDMPKQPNPPTPDTIAFGKHKQMPQHRRQSHLNLMPTRRSSEPSPSSSYPPRQLDVLLHNRHALRVNSAKIRVLEKMHQKRFCGLLQRLNRLRLPSHNPGADGSHIKSNLSHL